MGKTLGQLCKASRERKRLTQSDVAKITHFDRRTISNFERDERTEHLFDYACRLARAINDMELLRKAIFLETGVPAAGRPVPKDIDRHAASLRDLALKEKREAMEALAAISFWRLGPDQQEQAKRAALELLDAINASQWAYDAICVAADLDPDELMREHHCPAAAA